ncbi:cytochrome-c peroxidase [Rufibacter roseus]|uniref:Cytochrome-c peroxidase n=1 Tax=Rufibacter roseus TaxID=1567108 RepID=A0ABW2DPE5_9BACT|nr:cytochrome c peroxidase [Rufibacter roseus]
MRTLFSNRLRLLTLFLPLFVALQSCESGTEAEDSLSPTGIVPAVPANLGESVPYPERNPFTKEGILLGRKLFYDPKLSGNNQISCASCHHPDKAFSDGVRLSTAGASGKQLLRNVPALQNLGWMQGWFWDGGAKDVESLTLGPLTHPDEMDQNLRELVQELQTDRYYPTQFKAAFGSDSITSAMVARALAQFQRTLISGNSAYDRYSRSEAGATLSSAELRGLALVRTRCAPCHSSDHFTDQSYRNNGLDNVFSEEHEALGWGRGRITHNSEDLGKYKVPTLRNLVVTAPYMHDGRYNTLTEVLDHYQKGIAPSPTLDPALLKPDGSLGILLSERDKADIIAFLHTLTDRDFLQNAAFGPPPQP